MDRDGCLGMILIVALVFGLIVGVIALENQSEIQKCDSLIALDSDVKFRVRVSDIFFYQCMAGVPYHDKFLWFPIQEFQKANTYPDP